jgi:hypothetical protein
MPKQATPAQVAALSARQALATADPQSTASVSSALQALAYAPAVSAQPVDRSNVVAAGAPVPRSFRPAAGPRNLAAATTIDTVVAKGLQGQGSVVATSARIAASRSNEVWMRMMILAPSASTSMSTTVLGDSDMTLMRAHFIKPLAAIMMGFSDDPQMGMVCDRFTGTATATLATTSFVMRTAACACADHYNSASPLASQLRFGAKSTRFSTFADYGCRAPASPGGTTSCPGTACSLTFASVRPAGLP